MGYSEGVCWITQHSQLRPDDAGELHKEQL